MKPTYSKRAAKSISKISNPFKQNIKEAIEKLPSGDIKKLQGCKNAYRLRVGDYRIRDIIDTVDSNELGVLYQVLIKFIPESAPLPDEIEAIRLGRDEIRRGETVSHDEIDWD